MLKRKVPRLEMQIWRHDQVVGALGEIIISIHVKESRPKTELENPTFIGKAKGNHMKKSQRH